MIQQDPNGLEIDGHRFENKELWESSPREIEKQIISAVGVERYVYLSQNAPLGEIIKQKSNVNAPIKQIGTARHQGTDLRK